MLFDFGTPDLWEKLSSEHRTVVLYGMGNGADKILTVCKEKNIPVADVFASDGFVRGHLFHGKPVLSFSEVKNRYGTKNLTVLLSFGTSRPEVLSLIQSVASEVELYAPDVPAFGEGLFDRTFALSHREQLTSARSLLSDEESRRIFDLVLQYKLSGNIRCLLDAVNDQAEVLETLIRPDTLTRATADLGAYNGDTVRELLSAGATPRRIYAMEPDPRNFRKLSEYAKNETRTEVLPIPAAAWDKNEMLLFDGSGNRNASVGENRSSVLSSAKMTSLSAMSLDSVVGEDRLDYIKYDVEGAEAPALRGSINCIRNSFPTLLVSLYHRNEDLFALPLQIHDLFPEYRGFFLRRFAGIPAWDLNLYVRKECD